MTTAENVKVKLEILIDNANQATGNGDTTLTNAIASLIAGYGSGGESFPQKFYETDFTMGADITANGTICTLSTGLSDTTVVNDHELVFAVITCTPSSTPATKWVKKLIQFICPNQGSIQAPAFGFFIEVLANENEQKKPFNSGVGAYITTVATDLSSITINARFNMTPPAVGDYHLELYRMGVSV